MAVSKARLIPLELPPDEAAAFAQFLKRVDHDTCIKFANRFAFYSGRAEADTVWSAMRMLRGQLAEAGYDPR
jgi:hypothetical protein